MENSDSKKYFVKDEALHGIDNDQFHYADISKVLSEIIDTNAPPFNVAIIGKWGLGKSSLINLVTDRYLVKEAFTNTDSDALREKILLLVNAFKLKSTFKGGLEGESLEFFKKYTS